MNGNIQNIPDTLESVKRRPQMYVRENNVEEMESFIWGFELGCLATVGEKILKKRRDVVDQIKIERGWHLSPVSVSVEMRKRGLSDEEIIQELLTIEIESWRRMESVLSE